MGTIVIIPKCRLSYPILGVPERYKNDPKNKPRWGANFWIPKTDLAMVAKIDQTIRDVAREKWPKTWEKVLPEILLDKKGCCWIDGKRRSEDTADDYWTIAAYRDAEDGPPVVVDHDLSPIYNEAREFHAGKAGRLYAGCWVAGKIEIWAQQNEKGGVGIRAGLLGVQYVGKGQAFGGGAVPTAEGFEAIEEGADADDFSE
jgi:hypothetical protein